MKFTPLNDQPNISMSRFGTASSSMRMDSRGFPHIAWIERKHGHNEMHYSFWDGLQWATIQDGVVSKSEEEIIVSNNSLILDNGNPVISFSTKTSEGSNLNVVHIDNGEWVNNYLSVDYDAEWIGIQTIGNNIADSSSSSSSSSSDSSNITVTTYDGISLSVYVVSDIGWSLLTTEIFELSTSRYIKLASCGNKLGLTILDSAIRYNFFDVISLSWSFPEFATLNTSIISGTLIDFDVDGYGDGDNGVLSIAWMDDTITYFVVCNIFVDDNGVEWNPSGGDEVVAARVKTVKAGNYISYGFSKIGVRLNSDLLPRIFVTGLETVLYTKDILGQWNPEIIDINGAIDGLVPYSLSMGLHEDDIEYVKVSFDNAGGDIYYFEQSNEAGFTISYPYLTVLNGERLFVARWKTGSLDGSEIHMTYTNRSGDILREGLKKVAIVIDDNEDPFYYSSSSSSDSSSSSS